MNLEAVILEALKQAALPQKAASVVRLVKPQAGGVATTKSVTAALESLVASGVVQRIPAGSAALFTTKNHQEATAALLRQLIQDAKIAPQAAKLKAKLPAMLQTHFEDALTGLVAKGEAFVLPGAKRLVHACKPKPSELLDATKRSALQKIFAELNAVRSQPVTIEDFAAWLDQDQPAALGAMQIEPPETSVVPDETLLQQWYEQDRLRSSTMMIAIPRTFEHYAAWAAGRGGRADSQVLRNLMEGLYNNGRILLEPCERPQDLPEHERAMLVPMSIGPPGYSWCWIA